MKLQSNINMILLENPNHSPCISKCFWPLFHIRRWYSYRARFLPPRANICLPP